MVAMRTQFISYATPNLNDTPYVGAMPRFQVDLDGVSTLDWNHHPTTSSKRLPTALFMVVPNVPGSTTRAGTKAKNVHRKWFT
jgi:hypothetical protein